MEEFSKAGRKLRPRKTASTGSSRPHRDGDRPHFGADKPHFGADKPRFGADRPHFGSDRPRRDGDKPHFGSDRPRREGDKPRFGADKPRFGGKPGARFGGKPGSRFGRASDEGVDRMIRRRSTLDSNRVAHATPSLPGFQEEIRLNKFIANSGVCSRREADTYILAGVVSVNGEVVTELGTKVNVLTDDVRFNGQRIKGEAKVYLVMNKPRGFVTTASDPHAEKTVMDLLKGCEQRVFPVGRLDKNTTGVLMFTNDGEISERLTHPSYDKKKIYQVILDRPLSEEDRLKILDGITLSDGPVQADELEFVEADDHRKLGIEIHSGKNRIVRRIFEESGYEVRALDRVYFAGLTKKGLKKGEWRYLTEGEVNILKMGAYI